MFNKELLESISDFFGNIYYSVRGFFRSVKRSYDYAKFGWNNHDYDYGYLLQLMHFKLKRIENTIQNGYAEPDKKTNQSIRICIKLLKKLAFKDYDHFTELHYTKWGQPEFVFDNPDSNGLSNLEIKHKNAISHEDRQLQRQELLEACRKDEEQEQRDVKLLFSIMAKYHKRWWD